MAASPEPPDALRDLNAELDGESRADDLARRLFAQDASIYEQRPAGVVFPACSEDVRRIVEFAGSLDLSLIPRGGGTSLAGQCVGEGLVVDFSRMDRLIEVDEERGRARVQPGIVLDELNRQLVSTGWMFAPDTSTASRCQIGGMIGNNSCGSHSVYYGTTRDHLLEAEVVLADGSVVELAEWSAEEVDRRAERDDRLGCALAQLKREVDEHRELIRERYPRPELLRRNTGYPLDLFVAEDSPDSFPLQEFLCGTEGTLALTTEATVNLVPRPEHNILICVHFESLQNALRSTVHAVDHDPAAVELMDRRILELTEDHPEHRENRFFVEGDPSAILVIELYGDDPDRLESEAEDVVRDLRDRDLGFAYPLVRPPKDDRVWKLRKAGLGMLMGVAGDRKPVTVVEDTAVGPEVLPDYVDDFADLMAEYGTECVYYAHASVGELHLRPELNLRDPEDAEKFRGIARDVVDLVREYGGALSGEHGDGRVRSPLLEDFYGEELMEAHRRVKGAFDPEGRLNPGNLVDPAPIDEDWRVEPGVEPPDHDTYFDWSADGGLLRAAEKCNGAGTCRRRAEAGGTMCPSYRATLDEEDTTRGRANVLRQLLRDAEPDEAFTSDDVERALDLCLSCKACKTECPASVDMARLKAEYTQQRYDREGAPWSAWFFAHYRTAARLASVAPTLANFVLTFALTRWLIDRLGSLDPDRELPEFASERFTRQFRRRETPDDAHERPVVWLYVDPFTEFNDPEVGMAAVRVLEAGGYRVERFPVDDDGRTFLSKGFVDRAKKLADRNLERVGPLLEEHPERSVVGVEPSALLTFRDELPDLASPERRGAAEELADRALLFEEFVERACLEGGFGAPWPEDAGGRVELHGHCHQEALAGTEATERVLSIAGYEVDVIDSGCCGMAGSFGYEADHADVSREIGELTLFPAVRDMDEETRLAAPGFSCRHQIDDETDRSAAHPAVLLDEALERGTGNRE